MPWTIQVSVVVSLAGRATVERFMNCTLSASTFKKKSHLRFLPWETRVSLPGESQLRQSRATQPTVYAGLFVFHNPPDSDVLECGGVRANVILLHAYAHEKTSVYTPQWGAADAEI